jgi:hypothetical protein
MPIGPGLFPHLSTDVVALSHVDTGHNSAGNGGAGFNFGDITSSPTINASPSNEAENGAWSTATANQTNLVLADMHQTALAGIGGNGGDGNSAEGGDVVATLLHNVII